MKIEFNAIIFDTNKYLFDTMDKNKFELPIIDYLSIPK